ncbi:MAG: hypothetical protein ACFE95_00850, partial [Candidatus Hodarchaeota archaeon]
EKRIRLLETMLDNYNDGRSKSFFCKAAALLDLTNLENSLGDITRKIETNNIKSNDLKTKAKILKNILNEFAFKEGIELSKKRRSS